MTGVQTCALPTGGVVNGIESFIQSVIGSECADDVHLVVISHHSGVYLSLSQLEDGEKRLGERFDNLEVVEFDGAG